MRYFSFPVIVNIWSATWLLNALICILFAIAASNMRKFIWVCFSVHWIWEIFPVTCLIHWRSCTIAAYSAHSSKSTNSTYWSLLNTASLRSYHCHSSIINRPRHSYRGCSRAFVWTAMIYSVMRIVRMMSARRRLLQMKMVQISSCST